MAALGRFREPCGPGQAGVRPIRSRREPGCATKRPFAWVLAYPLPLLGLLAGCSGLAGALPEAVLSPEVSPQAIQARMLEPAAPPGARGTRASGSPGLASGAPPPLAPPPRTAALPPGSPALPGFDKPP